MGIACFLGGPVLVAAPGDTATAASPTTFNPLEGFTAWNVVSFGDTTLNKESQGPVAVGGTLTFSGVNVAMNQAAPVGDQQIGLVAAKVDFADSTGQLKVDNGAFRVASEGTTSILTKDQNGASVNAQAVAPGAGYGSTPGIVAQNAQGSTSGYEAGLFDTLFSQATAQAASKRTAAAAACNLSAAVTITGTNAAVTLTPGGANFWNVDAATLSSLTEIKFEGAGPTPDTPLIINVTGGDAVTFGFTMAGDPDRTGILWNMPGVTTLAQTGDSVDGSILAPNAVYHKGASNIQGNVVVDSSVLNGSEEHFYPFAGVINDCGTAQVGGFSVGKVLSGVDASVFPEGTVFSVTASWSQDGAAKSEVLELKPDGTVVEGPQDLPVGTVVTFSEADAPQVGGYTFTGVSFSPKSVTIADGVDAKVTATNTYEKAQAAVGGFSISKVLVDGADLVPAGTVFTVEYYLDGSATAAGTLQVKAGETVKGPQDLPVGTTVTFKEQTPPDVSGGTWTAARIDPSTLTIGAGTDPTVTVTNRFTQGLGQFSIEKKVTGADAGDRDFTFSYATSDGDTRTATVRAGDTWTSGQLPEGTKVTVTETGSTAVDGHVFSGVTFSGEGVTVSQHGTAASLVIGGDTTVAVVATNTYEAGAGTTAGGSEGGTLARTGSVAAPLIGAAGALLLAGGLLALSGLRRRRS